MDNKGSNNRAYGANALEFNMTGNHNIALGTAAGMNLTTGCNNIDIGNPGSAGESNAIRIGKKEIHEATFIAGISGVTVAGGVTVIVNANGRLGTITSSARFKDEIKPMDKASEAILALKPVTFRYKHDLDPAESRSLDSWPYTVRYEAVNAMLLNEFLKEHKTVQEQGATIARQQKQIDALTAGLQKVSAQLEASKTAPQRVVNNQQK